MRKPVSRWDDNIEIGIEERAGMLRIEFMYLMMGKTEVSCEFDIESTDSI
jgi:hypothetical protein